VDRRSKKAALFFVACDANPDTRVKIPDAMRIKGYSPSEAADRSLQMQVRREADKIKGEANIITTISSIIPTLTVTTMVMFSSLENSRTLC
jgi:hypothetical protein